jgi:hypothetical protein
VLPPAYAPRPGWRAAGEGGLHDHGGFLGKKRE